MNEVVRFRDRATRLLGQAAVTVARPAIRWTPFSVQRMGMETALNELFALPIAEGRLDFLDSRSAMIEVLDVDACWVISLYRDRLLVLPGREEADVVISGDSAQFLALGLRLGCATRIPTCSSFSASSKFAATRNSDWR